MIGNIIKGITEALWGQSTLDIGFFKFFIIFVLIYVTWKWITDDGKN